jgi:type I restriction enzyme S subunit
LDSSLRSTSDAIDRATAAVAFLREYRTRLIADVVTGKLDVCEAAARLRDEVEESDEAEVLDEAEAGDGEPPLEDADTEDAEA